LLFFQTEEDFAFFQLLDSLDILLHTHAHTHTHTKLAPFVLSTVLRNTLTPFHVFFNIFEFLGVFTAPSSTAYHLAILSTTGQRLLSNRGTYPYTTHTQIPCSKISRV